MTNANFSRTFDKLRHVVGMYHLDLSSTRELLYALRHSACVLVLDGVDVQDASKDVLDDKSFLLPTQAHNLVRFRVHVVESDQFTSVLQLSFERTSSRVLLLHLTSGARVTERILWKMSKFVNSRLGIHFQSFELRNDSLCFLIVNRYHCFV